MIRKCFLHALFLAVGTVAGFLLCGCWRDSEMPTGWEVSAAAYNEMRVSRPLRDFEPGIAFCDLAPDWMSHEQVEVVRVGAWEFRLKKPDELTDNDLVVGEGIIGIVVSGGDGGGVYKSAIVAEPVSLAARLRLLLSAVPEDTD